MLDHVGQQFGNYHLNSLLREGSFAQVYLGEHVYLKRQAAIKVLHSPVTEEAQTSFLEEAQIIARLEHPHIVHILDFGVQNQLPFLVMSYAPNGTLRQRHQQGSRLPFPLVVTYLKQIAAALQYAHDHNVIHRDVKPQNLLIGLNDEVLLSDFGLAIVFESSSSQNLPQQTGIVTYMAPEQFQGKAYPASDQYALGVVIYEWLCGVPPFQGTDNEIAMQHQFAPPPSLHQKISAISLALEQVMLKALAKDPKERFANVQEFAKAFEQACQLSSFIAPISPDDLTHLSSIADLYHQTAPYSVSPVSLLMSQSRTTTHQGKLFLLKTSMLLRLVLILLIGGAGLFYLVKINNHTNIHATFTVRVSDIATASARAYDTATANGVMAGFDAQHTNFNPYEKVLSPTNVSRLVLDWSTSSSNPIGFYFTPTVTNSIVFVCSGVLSALDARTGKTRWVASSGSLFGSFPAVANGIVYIDSYNNNLYAYNASSGKLRWVTSAKNVNTAPVVADGAVFVGSQDHHLYAFDAISGKLRWSASTGNIIDLAPTIANGTVFVGSEDHYLYAFNASTGKLLWKIPVAVVGSGDSIKSPVVANGIVFALSDNGRLYAFDSSAGKLLWSTSVTDFLSSPPAVANGIVFASSNDGLYAFDALTGKQLWAATTGGSSTPAVANGVVFVGSVDNIYAFDAFSGHILWASTENAHYFTPVIANGVVYVSAGNDLVAFHLVSTTP